MHLGGNHKVKIFVPKISLRSINTRSTCYERWVHLKNLTGGKSLEPVYGRLWKGTSEKSRLGDVKILLLLSSLILFHISQALTLSASVSRFKAKCNTSIFHLRGGWGLGWHLHIWAWSQRERQLLKGEREGAELWGSHCQMLRDLPSQFPQRYY